jgi:hypothetical protein
VILSLFCIPSALGLLLMAVLNTLDTWTGGREWNTHETKEML